MHRLWTAIVIAALLIGATATSTAAPLDAATLARKPRLLVVLVVDQLRGDALTRHRSRLLPAESGGKVGGFRWLMERGAWYPQAEHDTLHAMTGPGHATLLTGAWPYRHGIVLNAWWDRGAGTKGSGGAHRYCVSDARYPFVGARLNHREPGIAPTLLRGTTIGDALKGAGFKSRVVSVAIKDRAAVLLGGHRADIALWQERPTLRWITSRYYRRDGKLPGWVEALNGRIAGRGLKSGTWKPLGRGDGLSDKSGKVLGRGTSTHRVLWSPAGDRLTTEAAIEALKAMKLGRGPATDVLAVSLSAHDIVGHGHGHHAREMEEMLVSADRSLATLLRAVQKALPRGLRDALIVATSDHGAPPTSKYVARHRLPGKVVGYRDILARAEAAVKARYGASPTGHWVRYISKYELFIDRKAAAQAKADVADIARRIAVGLRDHPWVDWAFTRSDAVAGRWPPGLYGVQASRGWHPKRSGDVVAMLRPFAVPGTDAVTHHTGYAFDRVVPLLLAGPGIGRGVFTRTAKMVDLAPTLALLLGVTPPSLSEGRVLSEALAPSGEAGGKNKRRRRGRRGRRRR